jgi:outer membrane protein TolC
MPKDSKRYRLMPRGALFLAVGLVAAALGLGGCTTLEEYVHNGFKIGPNYQRPPVPLPPQWIDAADPLVRHGDPNLCSWWDVFDDPLLTKLVHDSFANNLTVKAAGFQILQAKEMRCIALGELMPQTQTFILGYSRNMSSLTGGSPTVPTATFGTALAPPQGLTPVAAPATPIAGVVDPGSGTTNTGTTSTTTTGTTPGATGGTGRFFSNIAMSLNASWELDFWGLFRRNLEAADASLDQSVDNYDEMVVLLLANVASQYVEIRTLQRRLELARKNVAQQEPLVAVLEKRWKGGIANAKPGYLQLLANLENTRALIPALEISLREANNELCVLLGQPVHDLLPLLGDGTVPDPDNPGKRVVRIPRPRDYSVVVGIPGEFLLRRPDVLSAEAQLRVQSAQIGIAEAEMFPHMGFNGTIGLASNHISHFFDSRSWAGNIGPSLSWNILNYGRLLANVRFQNYLFKQFVATYQQAILNANQDAENALVAYLRTIDQFEHLKSSADSIAGSTTYVYDQLKAGYIPGAPPAAPGAPGAADLTGLFINTIFTIVNFQVTQQDAAAQAEGNIALNLILLYRAMGGGWQIRLDDGHACAKSGADANLPSWAWQFPGRPGTGPNLEGGGLVPPIPPKSSQPEREELLPFPKRDTSPAPKPGAEAPVPATNKLLGPPPVTSELVPFPKHDTSPAPRPAAAAPEPTNNQLLMRPSVSSELVPFPKGDTSPAPRLSAAAPVPTNNELLLPPPATSTTGIGPVLPPPTP